MIPALSLSLFALLLATVLAGTLFSIISQTKVQHRRVRIRLDDKGGFFH